MLGHYSSSSNYSPTSISHIHKLLSKLSLTGHSGLGDNVLYNTKTYGVIVRNLFEHIPRKGLEIIKEAENLDMCTVRVINSAIKGLTIYEGGDRVEIVASVLEVLGGVGSSTWDLVSITLETNEFVELFNGNDGFSKLTCKGATAQVNKMKVTDGVDAMDVWRCVTDQDSGLASAVVKCMINSLASVDDAVLFYDELPKELKKIEVLTALITGMISVSTPPSIVAQTLNTSSSDLKDIVDDVLVDVLCNARGYEDLGINVLRKHGDIYDTIRGTGRARIKIEQVRRRRKDGEGGVE